MRTRTTTGITLTALATVIGLAGCSVPADPAADDIISVVASTSVYGNIAEIVGGDLIEVTSIIDDPSQDPHSFEADARVQLTLSRADIVIANGGGYDAFIDQLLSSLDNTDRTVLTAVELSPLDLSEDHDHAEPDHAEEDHAEEDHDHDHAAFNEHVWYDFGTMAEVASVLRDALVNIDPDNAPQYDENTARLQGDLELLSQRASAMRPASELGVAVSELVALYLLEAVGLHNVTPDAFTEAIEEGSEVSAATLNDTLNLFERGEASILVYNEQTTSPETEELKAAAERAGAPIVAVTELLPAGDDYVGWMRGILDELEAAIAAA